MELELLGFQTLASGREVSCVFHAAQNISAIILGLKYSGASAFVVIEMPPLPPGRVSATIRPRSNLQNFASFSMSITSSIPFVLDAFSLSPSVVYQDHDGLISIGATGVFPTATTANFALVLGSSIVNSSHMMLSTASSRTGTSVFRFFRMCLPTLRFLVLQE